MRLDIATSLRLMQRPVFSTSNQDLIDLLDTYWKFNESSDGSAPVTRVDSGPNNVDLTDNNTTPSTTGLVYALAADFDGANSEYFSSTNNATLDKGDEDFSLVFWVKFGNLTGTQMVMAKDVTTTGYSGDYTVWLDATTDRMVFGYSTGPASEQFAVDATFGPLTAGVWYMVTGGYDTNRQRGFITVNTSAITETNVGIHSAANTEPLKVGRRNYTGAPSHATAVTGPAMLFHGVLSTSQISRLYNGGAGLALF